MDGIHDLGGLDGFGPVEVEPEEPVFHEQWEGRVFGLAGGVLMAGLSNVARFRHSIERMDPAHYLGSSYYEHWLTGVATLLVEQGVVTPAELEARADGRFPLGHPVAGDALGELGPDRPKLRFAVGDRVAVRVSHPRGHTRCPRYVRGKRGVVIRLDGAFSVPDVDAHSGERRVEHTYSVRFEGTELWGEDAEPGTSLNVDLWDRYLDPA